MKYFYYLFLAGLVAAFISCQKDDDDDSGGGGGNEVSCDDLPLFTDEQHEQFFQILGSSCVSTSYYNHNQIGHATMVESDASPECTVPDVHFFKIHLGHADVEDETLTFDVDVFLLTENKIQPDDEIDLSENWVNAYYSYTDNGQIKMVKATSGTLTVSSDNEADFYGEVEFEGSEFEIGLNVDSAVKGEGSFVQDGDEITVEGKFLLQDSGLSPDCE